MRTLILGGVKSGKSRFAESLAAADGRPVTYVATAFGNDAAMEARIARHRAERPPDWRTVECGGDLAAVLAANDDAGACLLVDCLTLWLTGLIETPERLAAETAALREYLPSARSRLLFVSNEVGQGVVPLGEITRRFVDEAGRLHQAIAAESEQVVLVTAGLPQYLKGAPNDR